MIREEPQKVKIFPSGGVSWDKNRETEQKETFITLSWWVTNSLRRMAIARAPITGVRIKSEVDYSVTQALEGDFLLASFGNRPVDITLDGLYIYDTVGCDESFLTRTIKATWHITLPELYAKTRVSEHPEQRIQVDIANKGVYICAVVGLEMWTDANSSYTGIVKYKLHLIGTDLRTWTDKILESLDWLNI